MAVRILEHLSVKNGSEVPHVRLHVIRNLRHRTFGLRLMDGLAMNYFLLKLELVRCYKKGERQGGGWQLARRSRG